MKAREVHKLNDEELQVEVKRLRRHMFDLRTQGVTEKIADTSQSITTPRDIARLTTPLRPRAPERHPTAPPDEQDKALEVSASA